MRDKLTTALRHAFILGYSLAIVIVAAVFMFTFSTWLAELGHQLNGQKDLIELYQEMSQ